MSSFSSITALFGVSLTRSMSFLPSLRHTDAVRVMRVSAIPDAIFATVDSLQGAMNMASKPKLPEAIGANISSSSNVLSASEVSCSGYMSVSAGRIFLAMSDITRNFSPSSSWSRRTPYIEPEAPLIATTVFIPAPSAIR